MKLLGEEYNQVRVESLKLLTLFHDKIFSSYFVLEHPSLRLGDKYALRETHYLPAS
jgi:hypothetical protein